MFFCREKRIEDFFDVLGFDAAAVVAHRELDVIAGGERGDLAVGEGNVGGADLQAGPMGFRWHGLQGVDDEVLEDLENLRLVDQDRRDALGHINRNLGIRRGGGDLERVGENFVGCDDGGRAHAALGEREELFREVLCLEARVLGVAEGGGVAVVFAEGNRAEDSGEEIIEIVGDAADEEAERFAAVGFDELFGREGHLLGVAENNGDAARFTVGAKGRSRRPDDGGRRFAFVR